MSNYSERGFGARVENAQKILEQLKTLEDFVPPAPDLSIKNLEEQIKQALKYNELTTSAANEYAKAVDEREKIFKKEPGSFLKLLPAINLAVKAIYGSKSQELESLMVLSRKIRATPLKKLNKTPDEVSVSQSEQSYGNLTKVLSDIIVVLSKQGNAYNPGNPNIQLAALNTMHNNIIAANKAVTKTMVIQRNNRNLRSKTYEDLYNVLLRIKHGVKSQYGAKSIEYRLIKDFVV